MHNVIIIWLRFTYEYTMYNVVPIIIPLSVCNMLEGKPTDQKKGGGQIPICNQCKIMFKGGEQFPRWANAPSP